MDKKGKKLEELFSLEDVWKSSEGEAGSATFRELIRLGSRIGRRDRNRRIWRIAGSALAVAASLAAVALITFSLAGDLHRESPLVSTLSLVADYGETSSVTLADGTVVKLNSGSTLLYPESFGGSSRIVYLSGEGNFSVAKDPGRPFIVKTAYMDVRALGTVFSIKSYLGERSVCATLKEGKIQVDIPSAEKQSYVLDPDSQLVFSPSDKSVALDRVDASRALSWEDGYLSFTDASFPEIAAVLERRFNVSISYNTENMRRNALNVRFMPDETLTDALDVLTLLIPGSRYRKDGDRVFFQF